MLQAIILIYINITKFVLINWLEKYHSMIETRRLKNFAVFNLKIIFERFELFWFGEKHLWF